ncbi:hypothetical protein N657DRAFT_638394 [Parathielavia appendiculata]|uniref:Uncharacterized protein n=1 Tax=Parathielavia appendiculata TaxID=2587402 RepID=A0AAN6TNV1_9PEZI|nr:hypothetical protein N657DRAFT_638394 [Parathielavia appendiculata]
MDHCSGTASAPARSRWPVAYNLAKPNLPCRIKGEVQDLVVLDEIPPKIDGASYRVMTDPLVPPHPGNVPLDGDGNISVFRFGNGRVDMKMRCIETKRYLLERVACKALFGLYRGLPYEDEPYALDTLGSNPFGQVKAKTFTAHPKVGPFTEELVVFGYEATVLAFNGIVIYTLDRDASSASVERMKNGSHHWAWDCTKPSAFVVMPRRASLTTPLPPGRKEGESRVYEWDNSMLIHTGAAWESDDGATVHLETSRVMDNHLGIVDVPAEFPRIDERFLTKKHDMIFANKKKEVPIHRHSTGGMRYFHAAPGSLVQELAFIPRSADAPEGDGWVVAIVERRGREAQRPSTARHNWVDQARLEERRSLVRETCPLKISG